LTPSDGPTIFDRLEHAFAALARAVLRYRLATLVVMIGATAALGYAAATRLRVDASTEGLLGSDSPAMRSLDRMTESFGPDRTLVVAVEGDVFSPRFLTRLERLHDAIDAIELDLPSADRSRAERRHMARHEAPAETANDPIATLEANDPFADLGSESDTVATSDPRVFEDVTSLANAVALEEHEGTLDARPLYEGPVDSTEVATIRATAARHPTIMPGLVDRRGSLALVVLRPRDMDAIDLAKVVDAVDGVVARFRAPGFGIKASGSAKLEVSLNRIMTRDTGVVFGIAVLGMLIALVVLFRRALSVVAPLVVIVLAIIATHGAMALLDMPVTGVTSVLGTMLLVIGMADAVHVVSAQNDEIRAGASRHDAIVRAIASTAWPITFTAITDVAGLASFRVSGLEAIRDMGTAGSIGILAALVYTLTLLPVLLSFGKARATDAVVAHDQPPRKTDALDRLLEACDKLSRPNADGTNPRRNRVLLASLAVSIVFAIGAMQTKSVHDPLSWLPRGGPDRIAAAQLERHGFGTADVTVVVRAKPGVDLRNPRFAAGLEAFERSVRRQTIDGTRVVTRTTSILDLVRDANAALGRGRVVPTDARELADAVTLVESASPGDLARLASIDLATTRMGIGLRWLEASRYAPFTRSLEAEAARTLGDTADIDITGSVYASFEVTNDLNGSLRASFGSAVFAIALTMILLVFSVRIGLLAMIPNLVPILAMLGVMGFAGLPLDLNSLMVGSIAMGLVVDDTIHVVHDFVRHRRTLGVEGAVRHVFMYTGRALVGTSFALALGFSFFLLATLENVRRFGGLLALAILVAMVGDLILTPAVLRCLRDPEPPR